MDISDIQEKADFEASQDVLIWNTDDKDFSVDYDGKTYTIKAKDSVYFKKPIADHIKKHLATEVMNKRGVKFQNREEVEKVLRELELRD